MRGEPFYYCYIGDRLREYREESEVDHQAAELRRAGGSRRSAPARSSLVSRLSRTIERLAQSMQMEDTRPIKSGLTKVVVKDHT